MAGRHAAPLSRWQAHAGDLTDADVRRRGHDDTGPVHIAIDRDRQCRAPEGVVVHQIAHLDRKAQWMLSHPRVRIEEAILDVAAEATDDLAAIAVIGDAVGSRRTTAGRISDALGSR